MSRIPADGLSEDDCLFLLDHFFMANPDHMIRPFPRYAELYQRRGRGRGTAPARLCAASRPATCATCKCGSTSPGSIPLAFERDDCLRALRDKGRHFTRGRQGRPAGQAPGHPQARSSRCTASWPRAGQVELTTTPYFHPILPLLFDKKLAREAMPEVKLPRYTGGYPEDAAVHVRRAVEQHARLFGRRPQGMWPAEGSVCQTMMPLLAQHGIRWIATDEEVLSASTHGLVSRDGKGHVRNPEQLYRPYKVREGDAELGIVFRDHALSDLIGFHYQRSEPAAAADNFLGCLHGIGQVVHGGRTGPGQRHPRRRELLGALSRRRRRLPPCPLPALHQHAGRHAR